MKKFFNMIEVTLAIAVVGLGMTAIMALFPVGINASRDAIAENYAADCAEQFIAYIERECKKTPTSWASIIQSSAFYTLEITSGSSFFDQAIESGFVSVGGQEGNIYSTSNPSIYRITQGSTICTDFDAVVRIWKTPVISTLYSGNWSSYTDNLYGTSVGLNFEVSWPKDKPYAARGKKYYYKEIFKK
jgi:type II secretory pathway pseudopilin PulG